MRELTEKQLEMEKYREQFGLYTEIGFCNDHNFKGVTYVLAADTIDYSSPNDFITQHKVAKRNSKYHKKGESYTKTIGINFDRFKKWTNAIERLQYIANFFDKYGNPGYFITTYSERNYYHPDLDKKDMMVIDIDGYDKNKPVFRDKEQMIEFGKFIERMTGNQIKFHAMHLNHKGENEFKNGHAQFFIFFDKPEIIPCNEHRNAYSARYDIIKRALVYAIKSYSELYRGLRNINLDNNEYDDLLGNLKSDYDWSGYICRNPFTFINDTYFGDLKHLANFDDLFNWAWKYCQSKPKLIEKILHLLPLLGMPSDYIIEVEDHYKIGKRYNENYTARSDKPQAKPQATAQAKPQATAQATPHSGIKNTVRTTSGQFTDSKHFYCNSETISYCLKFRHTNGYWPEMDKVIKQSQIIFDTAQEIIGGTPNKFSTRIAESALKYAQSQWRTGEQNNASNNTYDERSRKLSLMVRSAKSTLLKSAVWWLSNKCYKSNSEIASELNYSVSYVRSIKSKIVGVDLNTIRFVLSLKFNEISKYVAICENDYGHINDYNELITQLNKIKQILDCLNNVNNDSNKPNNCYNNKYNYSHNYIFISNTNNQSINQKLIINDDSPKKLLKSTVEGDYYIKIINGIKYQLTPQGGIRKLES